MKITYEHNLGVEAAYKKVGLIIDRLSDEYGSLIKDYSYNWSDDHRHMEFTISANRVVKVKGSLAIDDNKLIMEGSVPFVIRKIFPESKLEQMAREQLDRLFAGESLDIELNSLGLKR